MKVDRPSNTPAPQPRAKGKPAEAAHAEAPKAHVAKDHVALSQGAKGHEAAEGEHSAMATIAHKAHNPHGALHALEAGEHGVAALARMGSRAASTAAEATEAAQHHGHHGLVARLEKGLANGIARTGNWLGKLVGKLPGGARLVKGAEAAMNVPGRATGAAAKAVDGALAGTRVGNAVRVTGSAGRFIAHVGGRIPVIGAVLGGVIGAVDVKDALKTLKDPHATTKEKAIAGTQGALSGVSGLLGVGALGVAGAAAIGLTAPVSVPALLLGAAVTGVGAFALSFFKKSADH